ncbi:uncharacterized protein LOC119112160 isoform X2 [Pollicipes pollicipes]|uniref:uncharacterized protein LOC119112160 isoform X2 n=1 Tax=Pollicipes pollicipes TaxID=41117 RepID=UPI0018856A66|nr:uncharacterized protein LOC119112160 isoform X2 [Pollicipes pollicipes]
MKTTHVTLLALAVVGVATAGPVQVRRRLRLSPVKLPLAEHGHPRQLDALVPVEPEELIPVSSVESRPVRQSSLPNFPGGSPLPDAPNNGEVGFFEMPPGFPNINSLGGFSDNFERSQSDVNNIEVIPIQFPESQFQSRQDAPASDFHAVPSRHRRDLRTAPFTPPGWGQRTARNHRGPPPPAYPGHNSGRSGSGRYQLPLSPVPYRAPFDEQVRPAPPPPPPSAPQRDFFSHFSEAFPAQTARASHLGSGNYVILRGGTFVDGYGYPENQPAPRPPPYSDYRRPNIFENFRDFAEFAHGSEHSYRLAFPEHVRMNTAETSTAETTASSGVPGGAPGQDTAANIQDILSSGASGHGMAANIQDILSEISNDVQTDSSVDSKTSHVKKRVLQDKRLALRRRQEKEARLITKSELPPPEDPMVATY